MRRLIIVLTALITALGLTLVFAETANANVTAPASGAILTGNTTLSESGGYDDSTINHCTLTSGSGSTTLQLINSGGTVVFSQHWDGEGARTTDTIDTHNYPNGSYTVRGTIGIMKNSGFLGLGCSTTTVISNQPVTIRNISSIAYSGATSGAATTSATATATLTDPNKSPAGINGKTVTFALSGGTSVTGTTNSSGVATAVLPISGPPRSATITASFAGDTFFVASSTPTAFTVTKQASKTTVDSPPDVVHGQATHFTAHLTAAEGTGTPNTGTVQFTVDGSNFGAPVAISSGSATSTSTSTLSTGDHTVGAVYSGDASFLGSTATTTTQHVAKAQTTTSLVQDINPTTHGQTVTFTATVAVVAPGVGGPGGAVQFTIDGNPVGTAVSMTGDHATLQTSSLHAGNHDVVATYNGNGDFASSDSATIVHGVDQSQTHVSLTSSDASAVSGQPLTFTAHVSPTGNGAGDPSGTVTFFAGGEQIGSPVAVVDGSATSSTTSLDAGTHEITATYSGDDDFAGSSTSIDQAVAAAATTTTVSSSPNPSVFGQSVSVHAEVTPVSPATGHPVGTIKFNVDDGANVIYVDLTDGAADSTLNGLAVGDHTIKATYLSGDTNFVTSTSAPRTQTVNKAATETTVASSAPTSVFGQPVTFTATVSPVAPGAGSPAGTITFKDGSQVLGTAPVSSATDEQASIQVSNLSVAQHAIVATYDGDGSFQGSNGSVAQKVERAHTSTLVTSSANPAKSGQAITFTANVSPVAPGAGDPLGTVTFTINGAQLGNAVMVANGQATSSAFATLSPGTYQVKATYSGDGHFVGSNGGFDQGAGLDVVKAATTMTLGSSATPADYGAPVTFTSTVAAVAPATGRPSGVVQFWEGAKLLGASNLAAASAANTSAADFVTSTLAPGPHAIRAVYVGNFNFDGQTSTTSQDIGQASTVTGISLTPASSTFGDDVTFTSTVTGTPGAPGSPSGTVTFREGSTVLGVAPLSTVDGSRQASVVVSGLHGGDHAVTATYSGDTSFAHSASAEYVHHVDRAASTVEAAKLITINGDGVDAKIGVVKATVTGLDGGPLAGEPVVFTTIREGDHLVLPVCQAVTNDHGVATCTSEIKEVVRVSVLEGYDATFLGNADYLPDADHGAQF
ncbi:MAG: hypothetical protein JWQ70_511 [Aeromicrobium sp.]|nr:hypothetical protein [Aeromicrobium sp.]